MSGQYKIEEHGGIATLVFNRPDVGNAISPEMVPGLTAFFTGAQSNPAIRCIVIRGEGKHFSTGGDVAGFARALEMDKTKLQAQFDQRLAATGEMVEAVLAFDRPIIAAVRGAAAGAGLMFALAADFVIADETALFMFSHLRISLPPDGGVSWLLPRLVGPRTATRLVLTAAAVGAAEALQLHLINKITAVDVLEAETLKFAGRFADSPQAAIKAAKRLLRISAANTAHAQLEFERLSIVDCVANPDFAEGVGAFLEKRRANFNGG
jgi:2-(1,2-epoxy-1,2-dihydrophenyl)acetyl-CoA isomerase